MVFYILRILREPVRVKLPNGYIVENTELRLFPIFAPVEAKTLGEAFRLALETYPNFRYHIAIQSAKAYHAENPAIESGLGGPLHAGAAD